MERAPVWLTATDCRSTDYQVATGTGFGHFTPMLEAFRKRYSGLAFLVAITIAFVVSGFAPSVPLVVDEALSAYVLAGGDLSDLCQDSDGDGLPNHEDCLTCHLVGNDALQSSKQQLVNIDIAFVAKVVAPRESKATRAVLDPAHSMRAPPLA